MPRLGGSRSRTMKKIAIDGLALAAAVALGATFATSVFVEATF